MRKPAAGGRCVGAGVRQRRRRGRRLSSNPGSGRLEPRRGDRRPRRRATVEYLSLLGSSGAPARTALERTAHHQHLSSLGPSVTGQVDVVWLPLLQTGETYTVQERIWLFDLVQAGGRLVWIGDADVYNNGDNSFLGVFDSGKLVGNLDAGLTPAPAWRVIRSSPARTDRSPRSPSPAATGCSPRPPHGRGVHRPERGGAAAVGVFVGFIGPEAGHAGAGRVVLICDASVFGQSLDQVGQNHRALLRNAVKWAAAAPGYTPSGALVDTGHLGGACAACSSVTLRFDVVTVTGETAVSPLGSGRCGFAGIPTATSRRISWDTVSSSRRRRCYPTRRPSL